MTRFVPSIWYGQVKVFMLVHPSSNFWSTLQYMSPEKSKQLAYPRMAWDSQWFAHFNIFLTEILLRRSQNNIGKLGRKELYSLRVVWCSWMWSGVGLIWCPQYGFTSQEDISLMEEWQELRCWNTECALEMHSVFIDACYFGNEGMLRNSMMS